MVNVRLVIVRGVLQLLGLAGTVVGGITWITGWRHGHGLITLGLIVYVVSFFTRNVSFRRSEGDLELSRSHQSTGEKALQHAESAVRSFRKYAARRPAAALRLATALDRQWDLLNDLGRHEEALPVAHAALETWRQVVEQNKSRREYLSRALSRVVVTLDRLNHDAQESIPYTEEAIAISRSLVAPYEERLALHRTNLAIDLRHLDRWEGALPAAEEAAAIYRRLAATDPKQLSPAAESAKFLAVTRRHLSRAAEAVEATQLWIRHERALADADPARTPGLAEALSTLGGDLRNLHLDEEALAAYLEALELCRTVDEPRAVADALPPVVHTLRTLGRHEEARPLEDELGTLRREHPPAGVHVLRIPSPDQAP
ncbi:tetratricopeptide repeat protein [Kribbella turkmenica]|nr:tetratricopeptide repeat protein [Kribbella turkmenica]